MADPTLPQFKTCTKCGESKALAEFGPSTKGLHGRYSRCRPCHRKQVAEHRVANRDAYRQRAKAKYWENPQVSAGYSAKYRQNNLDRIRAKEKRLRVENKELLRSRAYSRMERDRSHHNEKSRKWRAANPGKANASSKAWAARNRDRVNQIAARRIETPRGKLLNAVRSGVHRGLKSGSKGRARTFEILGYTVGQLSAHLESLFLPGMSWENYGEWHIDHVVPLSAFNFETPSDIDFRRAWCLTNLQPLWARDNRVKHAAIAAPFQPSLRIEVHGDGPREIGLKFGGKHNPL